MARTQIQGSQILDTTITDADVAAANKDGVAGTASLRTLGTGAQQAAAGNDARFVTNGNSHDHDGGDGAQVPTNGIGDAAVTLAKLTADLQAGWFPDSATWTYASATTLTISGDVTAKYPKGTKVKLTQTTVKYFYVVSAVYASSTTVTVTGGSDYSLANAAITSPNYSYAATPQAFPQWFNWAPTISAGYSANPTNAVYRFQIVGNTCKISIRELTNGTSNTANDSVYSLPVTAETISNMYWVGVARVADNGANKTAAVDINIASGGTTFVVNIDFTTANGWTAAGGRAIKMGIIEYSF